MGLELNEIWGTGSIFDSISKMCGYEGGVVGKVATERGWLVKSHFSCNLHVFITRFLPLKKVISSYPASTFEQVSASDFK